MIHHLHSKVRESVDVSGISGLCTGYISQYLVVGVVRSATPCHQEVFLAVFGPDTRFLRLNSSEQLQKQSTKLSLSKSGNMGLYARRTPDNRLVGMSTKIDHANHLSPLRDDGYLFISIPNLGSNVNRAKSLVDQKPRKKIAFKQSCSVQIFTSTSCLPFRASWSVPLLFCLVTVILAARGQALFDEMQHKTRRMVSREKYQVGVMLSSASCPRSNYCIHENPCGTESNACRQVFARMKYRRAFVSLHSSQIPFGQ